MVCWHIWVSGIVQGVGYRRFAQKAAVLNQVVGWAKNRTDGRVEILAVAQSDNLDRFVAMLKQGPNLAEVSAVHFDEQALPEKKPISFEVL